MDSLQLEDLPNETLVQVLSHLPREESNWVNSRLINKRFLHLSKLAQDCHRDNCIDDLRDLGNGSWFWKHLLKFLPVRHQLKEAFKGPCWLQEKRNPVGVLSWYSFNGDMVKAERNEYRGLFSFTGDPAWRLHHWKYRHVLDSLRFCGGEDATVGTILEMAEHFNFHSQVDRDLVGEGLNYIGGNGWDNWIPRQKEPVKQRTHWTKGKGQWVRGEMPTIEKVKRPFGGVDISPNKKLRL